MIFEVSKPQLAWLCRDELTEEEQMKKLKEAEIRRLRMQKIRKDNVENRKARIRATTGVKYRDGINRDKSECKVGALNLTSNCI